MYKIQPSFRLTQRNLIQMMYKNNLICNIILICIAGMGYAINHYAQSGVSVGAIIKQSLLAVIETSILGVISAVIASYVYSLSIGFIMFKVRNTSKGLFMISSIGGAIMTSIILYTLLRRAGMYEGVINQWLIYIPWLIFTASSCWSVIRLSHINQLNEQAY